MTEHPPTREGTLLEREAARVIRNAVSDFERETLSLSAVEYLLRRLGNVADILDRSDMPTLAGPQPQPQPQPTVTSMTDAELYAAWRGDRITDPEYRAECAERGWPQSFGGSYVMPQYSVKS